MQPEYEHEQTGTLYRIVLGFLFAMFAALALQAWISGDRDVALTLTIPAVICAVLLALFHSLTVRVDANDIRLWFGIGLIQKSFLISDIDRTFATRTHWYNGWGIRLIRGGWLFNIYGLDAVEIVLKNGRRYQLGTDEPEELLAAVQSVLAASR